MSRSPKQNNGSARTQVAIREVRDNVLILPGGRYRTVLATSSLNFELLSEAEQDALTENFQAFLNSLTVPVQVLVRVRELDIDSYLEGLAQARAGEEQEVYRQQLQGYGAFLRKLVSGSRILTRRFYVVIPYDDRNGSDFHTVREQLLLEQEIILKGLEKLGMAARPLGSIEILDLFYGFYRPETAKVQPLTQQLLRHAHGISL